MSNIFELFPQAADGACGDFYNGTDPDNLNGASGAWPFVRPMDQAEIIARLSPDPASGIEGDLYCAASSSEAYGPKEASDAWPFVRPMSGG